MSSPTDYITIAAIFALRNAARSQAMPATRADFAQLVQNRYGWKIDDLTIEKIIRQLDAWGLITIIDDKYAGETIRLFSATNDLALQNIRDLGHRDLFAKAATGGVDWFLKVFQNQQFWDDLFRDPMPVSQEGADSDVETTIDDIPASDRLVTRLDNKSEVDLIEADVRGLVDEISHNNEVGVALGDERDVITGELKAAETLISQPSFRLSRLSALVLPTLRFLAEKFASGAIGEMAKRLIIAILGLS